MKALYYRIKNALKLFVWALMCPDVMRAGNFKMLSDLLILILKVASEHRHRMTHIAYIHPDDNKEHEIVSIWAGAGLTSDPTKRIEELLNENSKLKSLLNEFTNKEPIK